MVAFTRWGFDPPRESLRVDSRWTWMRWTAWAKKMRRGTSWRFARIRANPNGWGALDTVLISRKPFSDADVQSGA